MKSLFLTLSLLASSLAFGGEVIKFDVTKTMEQQIHKTKDTIIYIGEDIYLASYGKK